MNLKSRKSIFLQVILLLVLTLVTYVNTFNHQYGLDDFLITDNLPTEQLSLQSIHSIFTTPYNDVDYRPISILSFTIERDVFGELTPEVSHRINVLLFAICTLLLFFTIRKLPSEHASIIAILAAMLLFYLKSISNKFINLFR